MELYMSTKDGVLSWIVINFEKASYTGPVELGAQGAQMRRHFLR